jgi:hypothetical protein
MPINIVNPRAKPEPQFELRVLIAQDEEGIYNATCLETGLVAAGPDLKLVRQEILSVLRTHIAACIAEDRPEDVLVPAPEEYWQEYWQALSITEAESEQCGHLFPDVLAEDTGQTALPVAALRATVSILTVPARVETTRS